MFTVRTTKPKNNKYYMTTSAGGYSYAIKGKPTDPTANVLANCVGYANSRFAEIMAEITGVSGIKYQLVCNAENFIEKAKQYGLEVTNEPTLGGIMVWRKGTLASSDGAGHVAVVEKTIDKNTVYTSESNYGGIAFLNVTRRNSNGRWGLGSAYTYRGCIKNPAVKEEPTKEVVATGTADYFNRSLAGVYQTTYALHLRDDAGTENASLCVMPKGTLVNMYGYYSLKGRTKWFYVIATVNGVKYTAFCSSTYLRRT